MDELRPQDIEDVLRELEGEDGTEEPLPPEVEQLLQALQPPNLYVARQRAAKQLGTVGWSSWQVVHDLLVVGETDPSAEVRGMAVESLRAPVHQAVLQRYPELRDRAQVLAQQIEAAQEREQRTALADETGTGQSQLAYRLAALVLFLGTLVSIVDALAAWALGLSLDVGICRVAPILIDLGLAIGLLQLRAGARTWVLVRAVLGAIVWPIFLFTSNDAITAIILTVIQWGFCGALILLLTGQSKTWRLVLAMGSFVIFTLGVCGTMLLLAVLASAL